MTARIVVIGAGPTGQGAAWRLHERGHENFIVLEAADTAGGLASSVVDSQGFTWDLGGHVVFSHYDYFDRFLDDVLGDAWIEHERNAWVWMRERFIPYPLQNNIWRLPEDERTRCIEGLQALRTTPQDSPPENFDEWITQSFGRGLADVFMRPYNDKVWAYPPERLGTGWMGDRVATVDLERVLSNLEQRRDDAGWGPNARFRFPSRGGTGAIWRAAAARHPERQQFGSEVVAIESRARRVQLGDGSWHDYEYLISSMPLDALLRRVVDAPDLSERSRDFMHSSSHIVGLGVEGQPPDSLAGKCWIYFPEPEVPCYRATLFSHYSPHNVARPGEQWSLMCEVSESSHRPVDGDAVVGEVEAALTDAGLLPDGAVLASRWHRRLEYGYPTPFIGRDELLREIDSRLRELGIWSRGRFGAWKYEVSNQDHSFMQGVEAVDHLLVGDEELTYERPGAANARQSRVSALR